MIKLKKNKLKLFDKIEAVRKENNKNWMDLLRLAYSHDPKETYAILTKILNKDEKLIKLANKLKVK
tara:strand:- start:78 stop:275 length:198 start_codon:yes stop_codon:yes gene_type:complete